MSEIVEIVEMYRDGVDAPGRYRFSCTLAAWELLRELAQTFGWQPKGTTYMLPPRRKIAAPARHDYRPGDALDRKQVEAQDAIGWAAALEAARGSPHLAAMIEARGAAILLRGQVPGELPPGLLEEFIEFAWGGAFSFAISTPTEAGG